MKLQNLFNNRMNVSSSEGILFREKRKAKAKWHKRENRKHGKEIKSKIKDHNNNEFSKFID